MRIVLASTWHPVGVGPWLLRAARRIQKTNQDLEVVVVGPTTGAVCWGFKEFSYPEHAIQPDFLDPLLAMSALHGPLAADGRATDLWIDIDGGSFTDHPMPWPHALVATDPHMDLKEHGPHWKYERQREVADHPAGGTRFFFCMQRPYCQEGDQFLPYAYDPEVFHPYPDQKMDADVTVLGLPYTKRRLVAAELQKRGFRVLAGMGSVYEKYARDLCRAPVCFIWSLKDDVPCRVFEAAACGRMIVVNESIAEHILAILPEASFSVFDDEGVSEEVAVYRACEAVAYWFDINQGSNPPRVRRPIAGWYARGQDNLKAVAGSTPPWGGHTWDARLRQIVKTCLGKEI